MVETMGCFLHAYLQQWQQQQQHRETILVLYELH